MSKRCVRLLHYRASPILPPFRELWTLRSLHIDGPIYLLLVPPLVNVLFTVGGDLGTGMALFDMPGTPEFRWVNTCGCAYTGFCAPQIYNVHMALAYWLKASNCVCASILVDSNTELARIFLVCVVQNNCSSGDSSSLLVLTGFSRRAGNCASAP